MGCSASKHQLNYTGQNVPLSRSVSFPSYNDIEGVSSNKISWTSSKPEYMGDDMFEVGVSMNQGVNAQNGRSSSKLKPKKEEDRAVFVHEEQSSMRRSNGSGCGSYEKKAEYKRHALFDRSASSGPLREAPDETRVPVWENKLRSVKVRPVDNASICVDSRASSFRCAESLDGNSGLRLLLSPVTTPSSRNITASSRFGNFIKTLSSSGRLNHDLNDNPDFSRAVHERNLSPSEIEGMGDSEEPGSPLFDPSILATFERAIEASSDDNWQSSEVSTSSSSRVVRSSSDICSDADSPNWLEENGIIPEASGSLSSENGDPQRRTDVSNRSYSNTTTPFSNAQIQKDYLEDFELKCPPGCEDKIVLYFTSLRGIRNTYENCCLVRLILKGYGVHVDERDIWMHSKFKKELTNVIGTAVSVPRVFIKGRYIGGAEDVKHLHEEGILQNLLEGLPAECSSVCDVCGGIRFVPCTTCRGSCKMVAIHEILRCPDCNENGLILCPSCGL
eukprot:c21722_g1_i3 orf=1093-2601(+)